MADQYQSTDRLPTDTRPELPRLLLEGNVTIEVADFASVTGGYLGSANVDLTSINDIGNTNKSSLSFTSPATYKVEVYHYYPSTSEFSLFQPLPYTMFSNYSTGAVDRWAFYEIINQHVLVDDIFFSTLSISYFADSNSGDDDAGASQAFIYKIWSIPFKSGD